MPGNLILRNIVYSRETHPNSEGVEILLDSEDGHNVAYTSGLAAFFVALTYFNPTIVSIGKGYHFFHSIVNVFIRLKDF